MYAPPHSRAFWKRTSYLNIKRDTFKSITIDKYIEKQTLECVPIGIDVSLNKNFHIQR